MSRLRTYASALLLFSSFALVACGKSASQPAADAGKDAAVAADSSKVLATVAGQPITQGELDLKTADARARLDREYKQNQFRLTQGSLEQMVAEKLLDVEAQARGISRQDLIASIPQPTVTDADIDAFYNENRAQMPPGRSKADLVPQIRQYLGQQRKQLTQRQFMDELAKKHVVEVKLEPQRVEVAATGPSKGAADAKVTLVEFSDFQCPYCSKMAPTLDQVMARYGDRVKLVFRHLPLSIHPLAPKAAEAANCAGEQGKFWEMHDAMFRSQAQLEVAALKTRAQELGLDTAAFDSCLDSAKQATAVAADAADAKKAGVESTPAVFVNGRLLDGAVPFEQIAALIEDELKRVSPAAPAAPAAAPAASGQ